MLYSLFMRTFQSNVMNVTHDPELHVSHLIDYCKGEAREAIKSCVILDPEEGFEDIMETLKPTYGHPHIIARNYINQLIENDQMT